MIQEICYLNVINPNAYFSWVNMAKVTDEAVRRVLFEDGVLSFLFLA